MPRSSWETQKELGGISVDFLLHFALFWHFLSYGLFFRFDSCFVFVSLCWKRDRDKENEHVGCLGR